MKKTIIGACIIAAGMSYGAAIFTDLGGLTGSVTATKNYTDAWVVVGYASDSNHAATGATFNGQALTQATGGAYDSMGGYAMYYYNIGALTSGNSYNVAIASATTAAGGGVWIVDGVTGISDIGYATYRDNDNNSAVSGGDARSFGFNLGAGISPIEATSMTFDELNNNSGDLILHWTVSGGSPSQIQGETWINGTQDLVIRATAPGNGGAYGATQMFATSANQEIGISATSGWYRFAESAIAFTVPEPATFGMVGLAGLGILLFRRLKKA